MCASYDLSKTTAYVSLRPLTLAFSVGTLLLALVWTLAHLSEVWNSVHPMAGWAFESVTGTDALSLLLMTIRLLVVGSLPFLAWWAVVERFRTPSKSLRLYWQIVAFTFRLFFRLVAALLRVLIGRNKTGGKGAKPERTEGSNYATNGHLYGEEE